MNVSGHGSEERRPMKAKKFLKKWHRMCSKYRRCATCPADGICFRGGMEKKFVAIVKKWAEEHPEEK